MIWIGNHKLLSNTQLIFEFLFSKIKRYLIEFNMCFINSIKKKGQPDPLGRIMTKFSHQYMILYQERISWIIKSKDNTDINWFCA